MIQTNWIQYRSILPKLAHTHTQTNQETPRRARLCSAAVLSSSPYLHSLSVICAADRPSSSHYKKAMSYPQILLFVIVGKNEPLYEAEFHKNVVAGSSDSVTRQNYFVLHSALDLVEKSSWTTNQMYLKVVDKVSAVCPFNCAVDALEVLQQQQ